MAEVPIGTELAILLTAERQGERKAEDTREKRGEKGEHTMPTWIFFMGLEAIVVIACVAATVGWMNHGDERDAYDIRLDELAALSAKKHSDTETH